jgi:tRNA dimethylallyltransferase
MQHLIVVGGATGSGKTEAAIRIAEHFGTVVLSADSRQFYREMSIGTAKPTPEELARVPHYFINSLSIHDEYSVGDFEKDALALLDQLYRAHRVVVVAGGSGLFINALCNGLDHFPDVAPEVKRTIDEGMAAGGLDWLQAQVLAHDPGYFAKADQQNPMRLRRALEVTLSAGQPYSSFTTGKTEKRPFEVHQVITDWPREVLYERINQRVDRMITEGLEEEARGLLPFRHLTALRTVGYEEWFAHFDGNYTRAEAIDKIKQHSRNYAKRQMTWFRKFGNWEPFDFLNFSKILEYLIQRTKI